MTTETDENKTITPELVRELLRVPGEVRGVALLNHQDFIRREVGEEGLDKLEAALAEYSCPLIYKNIHSFKFYPVGQEVVELLVIQKLFNFDEEKFEEIGSFGSKLSVVLRPFLKYFVSIDLLASQAPRIWKKYYTIGNLSITGVDKEKKYVIIRLENFSLHPIHCVHLRGYFSNVVKMAVGRQVSCEETQCVHRGFPYHEFMLKW